MEEGQRCPCQQTWEDSPPPGLPYVAVALFSSPGPAGHVRPCSLKWSRLCPGQTLLREEEQAEEGVSQLPGSNQKYICPSPAVCDLALLSCALSGDRCPLSRVLTHGRM